MPAKKLSTDEKYNIALEAVIAIGSKSGSIDTVGSKYGVNPKVVTGLMKQGLEGFKAAFYGNPDLSDGVRALTSLIDDSLEDSDDSEDDESSDTANDSEKKAEELYQLIEEHNDLVAKHNGQENDSTKLYPYVAITGGLLQKLCGMSQYEAKQYLEKNPEYKAINDNWKLTGDVNKTLFRKYPDYDIRKTIEELA